MPRVDLVAPGSDRCVQRAYRWRMVRRGVLNDLFVLEQHSPLVIGRVLPGRVQVHHLWFRSCLVRNLRRVCGLFAGRLLLATAENILFIDHDRPSLPSGVHFDVDGLIFGRGVFEGVVVVDRPSSTCLSHARRSGGRREERRGSRRWRWGSRYDVGEHEGVWWSRKRCEWIRVSERRVHGRWMGHWRGRKHLRSLVAGVGGWAAGINVGHAGILVRCGGFQFNGHILFGSIETWPSESGQLWELENLTLNGVDVIFWS